MPWNVKVMDMGADANFKTAPEASASAEYEYRK